MTNDVSEANGERRRVTILVATLIDRKCTGQTGQFFAIDGGWAEK